MKWLARAVVLTLVGVASVVAQERIQLQFELLKNGVTIAAPIVTVNDNATGSLKFDGVDTLSFTPSRMDSDKIALSFDVAMRDQTIKPHIVLRNREPGGVAWTSSANADTFELRVSVLR